MQTQALIEHLNAYLNAASFKDYAPNGLQVEGKPEIHRIVLGVSASQALIDHACSMGADCILVHHGWFWKGERSEVVGMKQRRLKALLKNDINLIAYHLPLDAHEEVGNNAEIARVLGLEIEQRAGSLELLCVGRPKDGSVPVEAFVERVAAAFGGIRVRVGEAGAEVRRVGWCSGAAQDELVEAARLRRLHLGRDLRAHDLRGKGERHPLPRLRPSRDRNARHPRPRQAYQEPVARTRDFLV